MNAKASWHFDIKLMPHLHNLVSTIVQIEKIDLNTSLVRTHFHLFIFICMLTSCKAGMVLFIILYYIILWLLLLLFGSNNIVYLIYGF